ncbi:MAG TPA: hypothetical protein VHE37_00700 [Nevskiaceae bacterium]|nr:hypothetical protein [Nevskiaceae bacterium]
MEPASPQSAAHYTTAVVFGATLLATFIAAWLGRRHSGGSHDGLATEKLNRWLVGLSAGAAANSGFIVTGAVGLGYTAGLHWLLLPLAWLCGDIVFWSLFPARLNAYGRASKATTLSQLIVHGTGARAGTLGLVCGVVVLLCLGGYISAQWLAGEKFLAGAFPVGSITALALFAALIVAYTSIGGFRGSVYVDSLQAVIRLGGTTLALAVMYGAVRAQPDAVHANLAQAGAGFTDLLPAGGWPQVAAFVAGFGAAALGFGLGQPHIVSRYLAGASPAETRSAWWIYMGFVQYTWMAMTLFGVALRGVMPQLADPEAGLSIFFATHAGSIAAGIIVADVFATISATANALLVAMAQVLACDLAPRLRLRLSLGAGCVLLGALTMALSLLLQGSSVMCVALSSVSMMAAGIAPAVMVKVSGWRYSAESLLATVLTGIGAALAWRIAGFDAAINEAAPGLLAGLLANAVISRAQEK